MLIWFVVSLFLVCIKIKVVFLDWFNRGNVIVEVVGWDDCGFWGDEENDNDD